MTTYRYGQRWHPRRHAPIDEIDEATARERFVDGPWFSVSALEDGASVPQYTLELQPKGEFVRTRTYTPSGSIREVHDYSRPDPDRDELFLIHAIFYSYPDDERTYGQNESTTMTTFRWKPDGYGSIDDSVRATGKSEIVEYRNVPVEEHWIPMPQFGDWNRFARAPTLPPLDEGS